MRSQRKASIEVLRLVAIFAIFLFHSFQPYFSDAVVYKAEYSWFCLGLLGCINLLGAFGNHVFFMISGFFLIPQAAASRACGQARSQYRRRTIRRVLMILATAAAYAALALLADLFLIDIPGVSLSSLDWLLSGLEFIWVYLLFVVLSPFLGLLWGRLRSRAALVVLFVAVVFAVNAYIAFISPGEEQRGLLEWRKLMSAVTYFAGFLLGGLLAAKRFRKAGPVLLAAVVASAGITFLFAAQRDLGMLYALSFKSTSLLSFALAACSLAFAAGVGKRRSGSRHRIAGLFSSLACWASPAILGVYIGQSIYSGLWRPSVLQLMGQAHKASEAALLACGISCSLLLLALFMVPDRLIRIPLIRRAEQSLSSRKAAKGQGGG